MFEKADSKNVLKKVKAGSGLPPQEFPASLNPT
jgi:hypothetical protein